MINLGDTGVSKLYLGDAEIKKAYVGDSLIFQSKQSRLPVGYTELQYISNPNKRNIENWSMLIDGEKVNSTRTSLLNYKYDFKFSFIELGYITLAGHWYVNYPKSITLKKSFVVEASSNPNYVMIQNYPNVGVSMNVDPFELGKVYSFVSDPINKILKLNDKSLTYTENPLSDDSRLPVPYLYGFSSYQIVSGSTGYEYENGSNFNFHNLKIYKVVSENESTDQLIANFVPAKNSQNIAGLFETLTETFYFYDGSPDRGFIAGPEI